MVGRPATERLLADFLTKRHAAGVSPATVAQVVQAIRFREKLHPAGESIVGPLASRTLAGIRRTLTTTLRKSGHCLLIQRITTLLPRIFCLKKKVKSKYTTRRPPIQQLPAFYGAIAKLKPPTV
jgi:hypothetical protein